MNTTCSECDSTQTLCVLKNERLAVLGTQAGCALERTIERWTLASDENLGHLEMQAAAPDALKVMCAKNFSNPTKFGIMSVVSKND